MNCNFHPDTEAVGSCTSCGKSICSDCAVEIQGKLKCRECLKKGEGVEKEPDPNTVFLIELVGGFFGLLGLGYLYIGRSNEGIIRLIIWIIYNTIAYIVIALLSSVVIGLICCPFQLVIHIGVPIWSAITLKNQLVNEKGLVV